MAVGEVGGGGEGTVFELRRLPAFELRKLPAPGGPAQEPGRVFAFFGPHSLRLTRNILRRSP